MKKRLIGTLLVFVMAASMLTGCGGGSDSSVSESTGETAVADGEETASEVKDNGEITIGFSVKTLNEERWQKEVECLEAAAAAAGVNLDVQSANQDSDKQISQLENMITNGVDVIMVCCVDDGALANVLNDAHEQGIKILSYDDNLSNTWVDAKVGYDPYEVGLGITQAVAAHSFSQKH